LARLGGACGQTVIHLARKFGEVLLIRAVPGVVNLLSLAILGERFSAGDFGIYSTTVATATYVGSLLLGPVINGILPEFNRWRTPEDQRHYACLISGVALLWAIIAAAGMLALPAFAAGILAAVAASAMTMLQEVLRGELRNWGYGLVALIQSVSLALATFFLVQPGDESLAVWLYGISNALGVIFAYCLLGGPRPTFRKIGRLRQTLKIGTTYTLSTLIEGAYTIVARYLIVALGTPHLLGVFSFCLDISQRLIGFLVSLSSFLVVPRAYKQAQEADDAAFRRELYIGSVVGGAASIATLAVVLLARWLDLLPLHVRLLLEPMMFVGIALAITVNRLKKILVDPVVVQANRTSLILTGYLAAAPFTLAATAGALYLGFGAMVGWILLGGYLLASFASWIGLSAINRKT